jgi:hypothetical protein
MTRWEWGPTSSMLCIVASLLSNVVSSKGRSGTTRPADTTSANQQPHNYYKNYTYNFVNWKNIISSWKSMWSGSKANLFLKIISYFHQFPVIEDCRDHEKRLLYGHEILRNWIRTVNFQLASPSLYLIHAQEKDINEVECFLDVCFLYRKEF